MPIYTTDEMSIEKFTEMVRQHPVEFEPLPARFWEDERWLFEHVAELARLYPEKWVAIYREQVAAVGGSRREARQSAAEKLGDVGPLVVYHLESKPCVYPTSLAH
ncbi:MAG: hypothetical protein ACE5I2_07965 [Anaerolineae bacterium]